MKFVIDDKEFETKVSLQNYIKKILYKYEEGIKLDSEDFNFMLSLLEHHPRKDFKFGKGIEYIYVKKNPIFHNKNFWIKRVDGSTTDFSYLKCLTAPSKKKRFERACRTAVIPYVISFREEFFKSLKGIPVRCPYSNEELTWENSSTDHKAPQTFLNLVSGFIMENKIDIQKVKLRGEQEDNFFQDVFVDKDLERKWIEYHNAKAILQVVSLKANIGILKRSKSLTRGGSVR